jgi:Flp pilus assembly pilin Flp
LQTSFEPITRDQQASPVGDHDSDGAAFVRHVGHRPERGLIAAGIAIAIITAVKGVGSALSTKFTAISTSLK